MRVRVIRVPVAQSDRDEAEDQGEAVCDGVASGGEHAHRVRDHPDDHEAEDECRVEAEHDRHSATLAPARCSCGRGGGVGLVAHGTSVMYLRMSADKQQCGYSTESPYVELAVEVFAMLADATRVRVILALQEAGELSVNHLADMVDKSPTAVSQHLAKLRLARIVSTRQEGQRVFYRLENEHASRLVADAIFQAEHSLGGTPRHHHLDQDAR